MCARNLWCVPEIKCLRQKDPCLLAACSGGADRAIMRSTCTLCEKYEGEVGRSPAVGVRGKAALQVRFGLPEMM